MNLKYANTQALADLIAKSGKFDLWSFDICFAGYIKKITGAQDPFGARATAQEFLGLDEATASILVYGTGIKDSGFDPLSVEQAVGVLNRLAETGNVTWALADAKIVAGDIWIASEPTA